MDDLTPDVRAGKKAPNYLLYGGILIVLVGGLYLIEKMKGSTSTGSGGLSTSGVAVGSSPPVDANTTENIYNISNVGNSSTTTSNSNNSTTTTNSTTAASSATDSGGYSAPVVSSAPVYSSGSSAGSSNTSSSGSSIISGYTNTDVPILATESSTTNTDSQDKLAQLASSSATSIPQLSSTLVAYDKQAARQGTISGVTNTNVVELNKSDSLSSARSILDSNQGVSIPGLSSSAVAYLQQQARTGSLTEAEYSRAVGG